MARPPPQPCTPMFPQGDDLPLFSGVPQPVLLPDPPASAPTPPTGTTALRRYVFAALDEDAAARLGEALADDALLADLGQQITPSTLPIIPGTMLVLHHAGEIHRAILLLDDPRNVIQRSTDLLALERRTLLRYGQDLSIMPLHIVTTVDALERVIREANADKRDAEVQA